MGGSHVSEERYCNNCKQQVVPQKAKARGIDRGGLVLIGGAIALSAYWYGDQHRVNFLPFIGAAMVLLVIGTRWVASMKSHCPICHTKKGMR
jgi:hypothetical protein